MKILLELGKRYMPVGLEKISYFSVEKNIIYATAMIGPVGSGYKTTMVKAESLTKVQNLVGDQFYLVNRGLLVNREAILEVFKGKPLGLTVTGYPRMMWVAKSRINNDFFKWLTTN